MSTPPWVTTPGPGGLVRVAWAEADRTRAAVFRVRRAKGGRLRVTEMHLKDPTPLGLRELRLGAVERLVNKPDIRAEILGHIDEEAPDVFEPFAEITVTGATQTGLRIHIKAGGAFAGTHGGGTVKLERPAGRRLGPDFYRDVLRARDEAETNGQHVLRTLQEATGAPRETVRRWLKEARKLETDSKSKRG